MKLLNTRIIDEPGKMPVGIMRAFFELALLQTGLATAEDIVPVRIEGRFSHYQKRPVDLAWIGFALGLRAGELLERTLDNVNPPEGF